MRVYFKGQQYDLAADIAQVRIIIEITTGGVGMLYFTRSEVLFCRSPCRVLLADGAGFGMLAS